PVPFSVYAESLAALDPSANPVVVGRHKVNPMPREHRRDAHLVPRPRPDTRVCRSRDRRRLARALLARRFLNGRDLARHLLRGLTAAYVRLSAVAVQLAVAIQRAVRHPRIPP